MMCVVGGMLGACGRGVRPTAAFAQVGTESPLVAPEVPAASMDPLDDVYEVRPRFQKGDRVEYDLKLAPPNGMQGGPALVVIMTVSVLEVDEQSVVLEFRSDVPKQIKKLLPKEALLNFEFAPQVWVDLTTFAHGLENSEEARQWALKYGEAQVASMERRKMNPEQVASFKRVFERIANDPHLLMGAVLKTPMIFIATLGHSGVVGRTLEAEVDAPNPFGEGTVRASRRVKLSRDGAAPGILKFEVEVEPDLAELLDGMADAVDRAGGKPFEKNPRELAAQAAFQVQQHFTVDEETGWPISSLSRMIYTHDGKRQVTENGIVRRRRWAIDETLD